ncbi:MAG TPA: dihydrodipicolinate synthase family protein [Streptosporangiaceae bacterium]|nr:dihydrodipicolinate synthase family protein [Streptosporangiaceae bacterium]
MALDPSTVQRYRSALSTVAAVSVTPFAGDGQVDWDAHGRLVRRMVDAGITLVVTNGTTGEFTALTAGEARRLAESALAAAGGSGPGRRAEVMVGIGHNLASAIEAGRHARDAGAHLVAVHEPPGPYVSAAGWLEYHRIIAAALAEVGVVVGARDPRVGARHLRLLADLCPNVVGVNCAIGDPVRFAALVRDVGPDRFTWLAGLAELSVPACWTAGARGFASGLANVAPRLALSMLECLRRGDISGAMDVWDLCRPFEELRAADLSADNVSVVKEALGQLGVCRPDVRPPAHTVTEGTRAQVAAILARWGITGRQRPPAA